MILCHLTHERQSEVVKSIPFKADRQRKIKHIQQMEAVHLQNMAFERPSFQEVHSSPGHAFEHAVGESDPILPAAAKRRDAVREHVWDKQTHTADLLDKG